MKSILSILLLSTSILGFSQEKEPKTIAYEMAVYPGCEKAKIGSERFQCFQTSISNAFTSKLQQYVDAFEYLNLPNATSKIEFVATRDGDLVLKYIDTNQPQFREYAVLAFADLVRSLNRKIVPAYSLENGEKLSVSLALPVGFTLNYPLTINENRVIATLVDDSSYYEIIETPNQDYKVYDVSGDRPFYLGKYNTLKEIERTQPYNELIKNSSELITLAQSTFGKQKFILQTKNIFKEKTFYTLFIVSEVKNKKIKQLRKYTTLKEFKESPYYQWVIREYFTVFSL